jgi:malonyl CoA-acyl carrier protein transacylase
VPRAQSHVDVLPRVVAIAGSSLGTLAVLVVAVATLRRRPLGNALVVAAVAAAAAASALTQTAVSAAAACFALAAVLLYAGATRRS